MHFRSKKTEENKDGVKVFEHASGYTDLEGVLGEHMLTADSDGGTTAPKGYRARSISKSAAPRR
jgi:hypothetical protein